MNNEKLLNDIDNAFCDYTSTAILNEFCDLDLCDDNEYDLYYEILNELYEKYNTFDLQNGEVFLIKKTTNAVKTFLEQVKPNGRCDDWCAYCDIDNGKTVKYYWLLDD